MAKCGGCGKFISATEAVKCQHCKGQYHKVCVNLPSSGTVPSSWRCPECTKNIVRDNQADTPIRGRAQYLASPEGECSYPCLPESSHEQIPLDLIRNLQLLSEELNSVRVELQLFRAEMTELRTSIAKCTERMDGLESRVAALEQIKACPTEEASIVDKVITELRHELNQRDQELLGNDLEITNIPETNGENPTHVVLQIATKLGVTMDERDIVSAARAGAHHINATQSDGGERRPRPLVVRLARRLTRDELLQSARVRRGATTQDLDLTATPTRFYINERLTKYNRFLFRKAREAGRRCDWRFIWTKRGTILARKQPGDVRSTIRSETDILRLFGKDPQCNQ